MEYTLHQLAVFLKVAETGSVTDAAARLFLSQPAVSIQLRNFQAQFPIPLTRAVGRGLAITDFGKEIAVAAKNILEEAEAIRHKTQAYQGLLSGQIKIATVSTGKYVMPYYLAGFLEQHPAVRLTMDVTNKERALESLVSQEVDFALVSVLPENIAISHIPILPQKLFLVGSSVRAARLSYPLQLEKLSLIFREKGSGTRFLMEQYLSERNMSVIPQFELTSNEAVKQAVKAGLGFSAIPLVSMLHELKAGELQIIPFEGFPIETSWQIIYLKNRKLMPAAQAWIEFIHAHLPGIKQAWFDAAETMETLQQSKT